MSMSGNNSGDDLRSDGGGGNPDWHPPPPPPYGYAAPYGYEEGQVRSYAYYAARPPLPPPPPPQYHPPTDAYGGYGGYYNRPHLQNHHVHAPSSHAHYAPSSHHVHALSSHAHYAPLPRQQPRVPGPMMQGQMSPSRNFQQHRHHVPPHAHYPPLLRRQPPEPTMLTQMSPSRSPSRSNTTGTLATPVRPTGGRPVSTPGTSGRSRRRRTDNNTDSNNEFVFTRNTTARPAQPTASTTKLTADQVKEELDKDAYTQLRRYALKLDTNRVSIHAKDGLNCDALELEVDAMELKSEAKSSVCPANPQFESVDITPALEETAAESAPSETPSVLENHSEDILFADIVDLVDSTSGSLQDRVKVLLSQHRLLLERCHAHITRNAGSRGGGWRGGKGSLCRALLNNGCNQNMMRV
ncbi:hypothetical protein THAOC_34540, partial [Thalassiosira oceanica]